MAGFFHLPVLRAGWRWRIRLVLVGLVTVVISIYYYIRVVRMMVVKEPQEMSDVVEELS